MKFNNVENECVQTTDGRTVWLSRSVAVVGIVCLIKDGYPHLLISQRGLGAADNHLKYCLPCGYLDWSENSFDAVRREVWEETGINIDLILNNTWPVDKPFMVITDPSENRQNVSITHIVLSEIPKDGELPTPNITNHVQDQEVADARWIRYDEVDNFEFAFNHKERLKKFLTHIGY